MNRLMDDFEREARLAATPQAARTDATDRTQTGTKRRPATPNRQQSR